LYHVPDINAKTDDFWAIYVNSQQFSR
jgi:hypothetical protein